MKSSSFYVVQGWMINELKLKGNELLVFAIIYGFSKDNQGKFDGSIKYLTEATGSSRSTTIKTLNSLLEKEMILKEVINVNNIQFCKYYQNELVVLNSYGGSTILEQMGSTKITPNNITNNNIIDNKEKNISFTISENKEDTNLLNNKQLKKEKKESERKNEIDFTKLLSYYNSVLNKSCRVFPENVKKAFNLRVKEGYLKEDIKKVIDNSFNDELHKENNYKYVTLEFLSRPKIFERYASMEHQKPIKKEKGGFTNY